MRSNPTRILGRDTRGDPDSPVEWILIAATCHDREVRSLCTLCACAVAFVWSFAASAQQVSARWPDHFGGDDPPARLADLELETLMTLRRGLAQQGVEPCDSSERLTAAARAHARQLLVSRTPPGRLEVDLVRREVRRAGSTDPTIVPWAVSFSGEIELEQRLDRLASRLSSRPPTHCGVGLAQSGERQVLVVIGVRRRLRLAPFPTRAAAGDRQRLEGMLSASYHAPSVLVTTPLGEVNERRILRRSGRFGAWIDFTQTGQYTVEVMATGPQGPEIVALFPVYVDSEPRERRRDVQPTPASRGAEDRDTISTTLLRLLNAERQRIGLLPLTSDPQLERLATNHSRDMLALGYFGHVSPSGNDLTSRLTASGVFTDRAAENLVRASTSRRAHARLMESPSHRANILDPALTHVGVGLARLDGELLITQIFVAW